MQSGFVLFCFFCAFFEKFPTMLTEKWIDPENALFNFFDKILTLRVISHLNDFCFVLKQMICSESVCIFPPGLFCVHAA